MQNNFISDKDFKDTGTIYSASEPVENFMGSGTENVIDTLYYNFRKNSKSNRNIK